MMVQSQDLTRFYERDLSRRDSSRGTKEQHRNLLRRFADSLTGTGRDLGTATREDIERWLDLVNVSARSRAHYLSVIRSFYRWGTETGHIQCDPTSGIRRPRVRRTLPRPMPTGELQMAISEATAEVRCWLVLGAFAGLRCQEIAGLDREDVIEDKLLLRVLRGKGGRERMVPLHPSILAALRSLPMPEKGPLFTRRRTLDRFPPWQLSQELNRFLHGLGIQSTAHSLRHWFGTELQVATGDLRLTQELMGHESIASTVIYTAVSRPRATAAVLALSLTSEAVPA